MKLKTLTLLFILFFLASCAFKPLYKKTNLFHPYKINIVVKSKENYENNVTVMKSLLNQRLNSTFTKNSRLKLVVSINRSVRSLGVNKDLHSDGRLVILSINYSFYDKKGELTSGSLSNSSSFNYTTNNYANIISLHDSSKKLVKSLSNDLAYLILAGTYERKIIP